MIRKGDAFSVGEVDAGFVEDDFGFVDVEMICGGIVEQDVIETLECRVFVELSSIQGI